jgi:hypothetical protein
MQFAPSPSGEKGSANSRPVVFGALGFGTRGVRLPPAAIPPGCSAACASDCADRCCVGSHIGMTCTVGCAGSGATGWRSCGGRGDAGLARKPSGQTSARTLHGAGRGRSSTGLGPLRRTWTTSTTLLLPPTAPLLRRALSTRRCSLCEDCAPRSFRRGNTRSASDMTFHEYARLPRRRRLRRCSRDCNSTECVRRLLTPKPRHRWASSPSGKRGRPAQVRAGKGVVRAKPGSESGHGGPRAVPMARPVRR